MGYSAFEQFEIIRLINIHPFYGNMDMSITNSTIFILIPVMIWYGLYTYNVSSGKVVPGRWQSVMELIYLAMINVIKDSIGSEGKRYYGFILTLFVLIGLINMIGIVPYTFTPTSHIIVTLGMSVSIWIGCTIIGISKHRWNWLAQFLPANAPVALGPFLIIIEVVSYIAKAVSLGVRLGANLTAGHLLFAILSGFAWTMLTSGGMLTIASIFPIVIVLFITVLEMAVALIQAYVFTLLTAIYINDSIHLH